MKKSLALAVAVLGLAACGQAPPPPASVPAESPKPAMPALADWVQPLNGKPLTEVAPTLVKGCNGVVDGLNVSYSDGARLIGWAWNNADKAPFSKFIGVDNSGIIRGGGSGGLPRDDVMAALPGTVTVNSVGYTIDTVLASGSITIYGFNDATKTACQIGQFSY